ncbi:MAG: hypothetical protein BAJALOKI2v1_740010 [Promethearchaeota archaeon]|nr:MAG: hypothetical protein BAJALOKI2v1_740010 [Candidatus Lokiarchaeota archaeon]
MLGVENIIKVVDLERELEASRNKIEALEEQNERYKKEIERLKKRLEEK